MTGRGLRWSDIQFAVVSPVLPGLAGADEDDHVCRGLPGGSVPTSQTAELSFGESDVMAQLVNEGVVNLGG